MDICERCGGSLVIITINVAEGTLTARVGEPVTLEAHVRDPSERDLDDPRIREGVPETIATSSLHLDIIRDYRRINSAMVSVAYPILEETGQLRSSRLKSLKKN